MVLNLLFHRAVSSEKYSANTHGINCFENRKNFDSNCLLKGEQLNKTNDSILF